MWSNWAGNETSPLQAARPATLAELQQTVARARSLRVVGAGHSFAPLIAGNDQILDLTAMDAPAVSCVQAGTAWVNPNARLAALSPALATHDVAFRNLGDINAQTLAGAISTATHGTGQSLPCLSAELTAARLIGPAGQVLTTDDIPLDMVQVSLGLLGILTEARINVVPRYNLRRRVRLSALSETLDSMHEKWADARNFEFFFIPFTGKTVEITHEMTTAKETRAPRDLDMVAVKVLKLARNAGRVSPGLRRFLLNLLTLAQSDEDFVGESWRVLCSDRRVRFKEMEYHLPPEAAQEVLKQIIDRLQKDHAEIYFPIEVRQTAGMMPVSLRFPAVRGFRWQFIRMQAKIIRHFSTRSSRFSPRPVAARIGARCTA